MTKRILVVEDDGDSRRILRDLLGSADYQMLEAEDGKQGIAIAERSDPI
jgi:two-component system cell cycle response regulator DivK